MPAAGRGERGFAANFANSWTWATPIRPARSSTRTSGSNRNTFAVRDRRAASPGEQFVIAIAHPRGER
jgi:hypothetical protein